MKRTSISSFLDEAIALLVHHFGVDRVRVALSKVSYDVVKSPKRRAPRSPSRPYNKASPSITSILETLLRDDEQKHRLLADFYTALKDRKVLPESEDIRQFAQLVGLKEVHGKSRKDMIPRLMRFLFQLKAERLQHALKAAPSVSEQHRQQGFSVLTDKLLRDK